jgi:hypothetical protein
VAAAAHSSPSSPLNSRLSLLSLPRLSVCLLRNSSKKKVPFFVSPAPDCALQPVLELLTGAFGGPASVLPAAARSPASNGAVGRRRSVVDLGRISAANARRGALRWTRRGAFPGSSMLCSDKLTVLETVRPGLDFCGSFFWSGLKRGRFSHFLDFFLYSAFIRS